MQILYSGAKINGGIQTDPLKSLGGLVSSSMIPNGTLNAIFPPISRNHIEQNINDVRLIVIKNETASVINNIQIFSTRGTYSSYKGAVVLPAHNPQLNCDEYEQIQSGNSLPYQAVLDTIEGLDNAIAISSLASGASIGLWLQRSVDLSQFTELDGKPVSTPLTNEQIIALLQAEQQATRIDEGSISITW